MSQHNLSPRKVAFLPPAAVVYLRRRAVEVVGEVATREGFAAAPVDDPDPVLDDRRAIELEFFEDAASRAVAPAGAEDDGHSAAPCRLYGVADARPEGPIGIENRAIGV